MAATPVRAKRGRSASRRLPSNKSAARGDTEFAEYKRSCSAASAPPRDNLDGRVKPGHDAKSRSVSPLYSVKSTKGLYFSTL